MIRYDETQQTRLRGAANRGRAVCRLIAVAILLAGGAAASQAPSGVVVAWGRNDDGETSVPAGLSGVIAVSAGASTRSLALKSDSIVVAWGLNFSDVPAGLTGVTAISAGAGFNLALKSDGAIVAWGDNSRGQTNVPAGLNGGVIAIAAGEFHSLALKSDRTIVAWGDNVRGVTDVPQGLSGVIAIAAGVLHNLALKSDGTVVAWGDNAYGESTVPAGLSGVTAISANVFRSMALKSDGTVVAWGRNVAGESTVPAGLSGVIAISAGAAHSLALKSDGTVVAWGSNTYGQSTVPAGLSGVVAIAAGTAHSLAIAAPVVTPIVSGALGNNGWYINTVAVSWTVSYQYSPITSKSGCDPSMVTSDTTGTTFTCTAASLGGVNTNSVTLKRDAGNPVISCALGEPELWYNSDVTAGCLAGDPTPGSGLANAGDARFQLVTSVPSGTETANASTNRHTVYDNAGNYSVAVGFPGVKVDKKAPGISITSPAPTTYLMNQVVTANYSCSDGGSGVATCAGTLANGSSINTATFGAKTFTVNAADKVGNTGSASVNYNVGYSFSGFVSPLSSPPAVNTGKAGRTYPIQWQLRDGNGNFIRSLSAVASLTYQAMACSTSPGDPVTAGATGGSGLRYDITADQYVYNWATPSTPGCYTLLLTLDSGQMFPVNFNLSK